MVLEGLNREHLRILLRLQKKETREEVANQIAKEFKK